MNENQPDTITYHAMLVVWGQFGQSIGLIRAIEAFRLHQKKQVGSLLGFIIGPQGTQQEQVQNQGGQQGNPGIGQ